MFIAHSDGGTQSFSTKARCSNRKRFETILSSGAHETIAPRRESVRLDHRLQFGPPLIFICASSCCLLVIVNKERRGPEATIGASVVILRPACVQFIDDRRY